MTCFMDLVRRIEQAGYWWELAQSDHGCYDAFLAKDGTDWNPTFHATADHPVTALEKAFTTAQNGDTLATE